MMRTLTIAILALLQFSLAAQKTKQRPVVTTENTVPARPQLSDSALLDLVQQQTFRYFWNFAHPISAMARERSNAAYDYGNEVVTTGGTGFGVMSVIVATQRKWIERDTAARFLLKMVNFLLKA
ncbi:MAG TPA: hypothetical protein VK644_01455, partial [Chitinophagaceae bacterium]|nr:hypothetical protein [Chitinophagaceae bacterium]